jgi:fructose/tagatose bisphosphate aldolase
MCARINQKELGGLVREIALTQDNREKIAELNALAAAGGIFPASIQLLYEAIGKGAFRGFTVPAMNIRGITYETARAAFRAALKNKVGPFIFEIARSEMAYTLQTPAEYAAVIKAAALAEHYQGPVFIQGDHMQLRRVNYAKDAKKETDFLRDLIRQCVEAGFYNIDIDASTLVDIDKKDLLDQQAVNGAVTAELTKYIRDIQPAKFTISVGGEIGEIGSGNSTVGDLRAFMQKYRENMVPHIKGISKISVQTGTTHGGIALPDGTMAKVQLDFATLETLSKQAREEYGLGGAVQHGASTLPDEMFDIFPRVGTLEVHLATGFQNIVFDSRSFPPVLLAQIQSALDAKYASDRQAKETETQFIYRNRKRAFGDFKEELWNLPAETLGRIGEELEERFALLYRKLNVNNTRPVIDKLYPGSKQTV